MFSYFTETLEATSLVFHIHTYILFIEQTSHSTPSYFLLLLPLSVQFLSLYDPTSAFHFIDKYMILF